MKYLTILFGVIGTGAGLLGWLLIVYAFATRGVPADPWGLVLIGFFGLLATGCLAAGVQGILNEVRAWAAPAYPADQPWLGVEEWRKRHIVFGSVFHGFALVLAYVFFGGLALIFVWGAIYRPHDSAGLWIQGLVWAAWLVFFLVALTYWWFRHVRYGDSFCRLLTLPGVIGGWFKADVECALPRDPDETVIVRLVLGTPLDKKYGEIWRIEDRLTVPVTAGKRSIVPVRLRVPQPPPMLHSRAKFKEYLLTGRYAWYLEIEKKTAGVDFYAVFSVPIYDTEHAPPEEQQAD